MHYGRLSQLGLALAFSLALPQGALATVPVATAGAAEGARARFAGPAFRYAGGDAQRAGLRASIDRVVGRMNFIKRPIARRRIAERNPVYASIAFRFPPGAIDTAMAGRPSIQTRADGSPVRMPAITGEPLQVSQRFEGNRIVQVMSSNEGVRRNVFTVSPDGHRLTMSVDMRSPQLPAPVVYQLTYQR